MAVNGCPVTLCVDTLLDTKQDIDGADKFEIKRLPQLTLQDN